MFVLCDTNTLPCVEALLYWSLQLNYDCIRRLSLFFFRTGPPPLVPKTPISSRGTMISFWNGSSRRVLRKSLSHLISLSMCVSRSVVCALPPAIVALPFNSGGPSCKMYRASTPIRNGRMPTCGAVNRPFRASPVVMKQYRL